MFFINFGKIRNVSLTSINTKCRFLSIKDGEIVQNQNDTINPSQIGSDTARAGIGVSDINQSTREMRDSLSPDKMVAKGEEPRN